MTQSRQGATAHWVQTVPVRITVDVLRVNPRRVVLADDPRVEVRGVIDLSPDPTERALPVWFNADIQLYSDRTAEILSFSPVYGDFHGTDMENLLALYEQAFARSLVDTKLGVLGVLR